MSLPLLPADFIAMGAVAAALAVAGAALLFAARQRQAGRRLEERVEELTDGTWELRDAAERARSLLQAQGDLILRRDAGGAITYANDAYRALAGVAGGADAAPPLTVLEQGPQTLLADGTRLHDQKIAGADGPRWISWREAVVPDPQSRRTETQSVGRDVTARAQTEEALARARDLALAASRAKSRFLAAMSHEIRTPLNGILGMADLLADTPLTPEQATYADAVRSSGRTLLALIEDILDFSKIEAGRLDLVSASIDLEALVEEILELLGPRAQSKGLEIASYVDPALPRRVTGDPMRLRQVLLNLAGNAVKFTESGGIAITVEEAPDGRVAFAVADTGIGIPPEEQERIFGEFEQGDDGAVSQAVRQAGGSGLGLAISRRIVEHMGGRIALESRAGAGARFCFAIPLPGAENDIEGPAPDDLSRLRVLIAGAPVAAPLIARHLTKWGGLPTAAPDAEAALALITDGAWGALIADRALGPDALGRLARAAPVDCRLIVTLAPAERSDLAAMQAMGYAHYLIKPLRAHSLAAVLAGAPLPRPNRPAAEAAALAEGSTRALRVLIAEDNEINALLGRKLLEKMGHRATVAVDGAQAVESWRAAQDTAEAFDIILMDVQMPELDGLEAARRIRAAERAAGLDRTPILALSANAFAEDRAACAAAGMDGFLVKPLDRAHLADHLAARTARRDLSHARSGIMV